MAPKHNLLLQLLTLVLLCAQNYAQAISRPLRILHLSDTHNMHRQIEKRFGPLPHNIDVVTITGDMTVNGDDREFADFNAWLGEIKKRYGYKHILVIVGNHDWWASIGRGRSGKRVRADVALDPKYMQDKLTNARVLNHELVTIEGLRIFGAPWDAWQQGSNPDNVAVRSMLPRGGSGLNPYKDIPVGTHIVLTHGPAAGIFDSVPHSGGHWGGSRKMKDELLRKKVLAHFFGHVHAQRGFWVRSSRSEGFAGLGSEYKIKGRATHTEKPKPSDSSCLLISNNAMASENHADHSIAGPARLIIAEPSSTPEGIHFRVVQHGSAEYSGPGSCAPARPMLNEEPTGSDVRKRPDHSRHYGRRNHGRRNGRNHVHRNGRGRGRRFA